MIRNVTITKSDDGDILGTIVEVNNFVYHYQGEDDGSLEQCDCNPDECQHGYVHIEMDKQGRSHIWSAVGVPESANLLGKERDK